MSPLFFVIIGPVLVFLFIWAAATAYRLYFPEQSFPFDYDSVVMREQTTADGERTLVGFREIRAEQRREQRQEDVTIYNYAWGASEGVPEAWREDLWKRRN